ncbi:MAG: flagellar brake protein [Chromatiales bacterium]|jgi:c-di-GMP-binding flagellar brake protein YcgR
MTEEKLRFPVGTRIQLQPEGIDNNPTRYNVMLLGYYPGKSLIVTNPESQPGKTVLFRDSQAFIARIMQGSVCQAFRATAIQTNMLPYPHLHLSYPDEIEMTVVRNASRIATKQPALVRNLKATSDKRFEAMVVDLSSSGAKVATRVPVAEVGDSLHVKMQLEVANETDILNLAAEVKKAEFREGDRQKGRLDLYYYGLMFEDLNRFQKVLLHAYVMEFAAKLDPSIKL